ncbi:MAG: hypothetical protein ABEJ07_03935 [Candidatus Nanohaloarchaea archaeon]
MRAEIKPVKQKKQLAENLEKRVEEVEVKEEMIVVEVEDADVLLRTPGIESFTVEGKEKDGLGGKPVGEQAYARIESREDAVRAFLATVMGYDLRVLDTSREWDYRNLKRYNPDIKHLKFSGPREELGIDKALFDSESTEKIEVELDSDEVDTVYREMMD